MREKDNRKNIFALSKNLVKQGKKRGINFI